MFKPDCLLFQRQWDPIQSSFELLIQYSVHVFSIHSLHSTSGYCNRILVSFILLLRVIPGKHVTNMLHTPMTLNIIGKGYISKQKTVNVFPIFWQRPFSFRMMQISDTPCSLGAVSDLTVPYTTSFSTVLFDMHFRTLNQMDTPFDECIIVNAICKPITSCELETLEVAWAL